MAKVNIITEHATEVDAEGNPRKLSKEEQYYEGSPTCIIEGSQYEYHPYGIDGPQLVGNELGHERQNESDHAWGESCAPVRKLEFVKSAKISANQAEAGVQISALYSGKAGEALSTAQRNDLMVASVLNRKTGKGSITPAEELAMDAMEAKAGKIELIRKAENDAAILINACTTIAAVEAIPEPAWPV